MTSKPTGPPAIPIDAVMYQADLKHTTLELKHHIWEADDFTEFKLCSEPENDSAPTETASDFMPDFDTKSCQGNLQQASASKANDIGRFLLCKCYGGEYWSMTARVNNKAQKLPYCPLEEEAGETKYAPARTNTPSAQYPIPQRVMWDVLHDLIFKPEDHHPHGVIVITGATSTGKSTIVRGLIHAYLEPTLRKLKKGEVSTKRRPHLLTVEDPIETYYFKDKDPFRTQKRGLDYTPREIGADTTGIAQVFQDALRQTPAVVYVGEVRRLEDWKIILDFAGTGHLVITTAHAGSLIEAMDRILKAAEADSPARRGQVAESLLAVIHLQNTPIDRPVPKGQPILINPDVEQQNITLPALWRRTSTSIATLVADGLASIMPGRHHNDGSLGRLWFAETLADYSSSFFHLETDKEGHFLHFVSNEVAIKINWDALKAANAVFTVAAVPPNGERPAPSEAILTAFANKMNEQMKEWKQKELSVTKQGDKPEAAKLAEEARELADAFARELVHGLNALIWELEHSLEEMPKAPVLPLFERKSERLKRARIMVQKAFSQFIIEQVIIEQAGNPDHAGCIEDLKALCKEAAKYDVQGR